MFKLHFAFIIWFILNFIFVDAQVKTTFFDRNSNVVDSVNSYYFNQKQLFGDSLTFSYFTSSKKLRHSEKYLNKEGEVYVKFFFENGKLKSEGNRLYGPKGKVTSYYFNGNKKSELFFEEEFFNPLNNLQIISYYDSAGNEMIKDGAGHCVCELAPFEYNGLLEEGNVVSRIKNGLWKGVNAVGGYRFEETYDSGKFIKGISFYKNGESYQYFNFEETARPEKGMTHFFEYISKSINYPKAARRNRVEGKVFVQFIIDKDGSILDPKVINGIGAGCDEEALKAIRNSPKWIPGNQRGRPVKQRYTMPIMFKLG